MRAQVWARATGRERLSARVCVCVLQFARACLRFVSVRASGSLTLSTLQPVHVCLSTLRMHHGAPAHTHTQSMFWYLYVFLQAGVSTHQRHRETCGIITLCRDTAGFRKWKMGGEKKNHPKKRIITLPLRLEHSFLELALTTS